MVVVTSFTNLLGVTNSIVGVVTVLGILTFRFSNLDFDVNQSVLGIMGILMIFAVSPFLVTQAHPIIGFCINAISMMAIVVISCHNVALSNQSTLLLSYILLYGYEINTVDDFMNRVFGLILGGVIVAGIF